MIGEMLGVKFDAETMDEKYRNEGISLQDQIKKQLSSQLFLHDDRSGEMLTPEAMARRRLAEGKEGNKAAATEVGSILDGRVGGTFSKEFNENSPEGKEAKKLKDKQEKEAKKRRKEAEQDRQKAMGRQAYLEELEFNGFITDGEAAELSDLERAQNKRNDQAREKKAREAKRARKDNEREAREAAPGIKTMSEMLAVQAFGGAITPDQARQAIAKHLLKEGVAAEKSVGAADDIFTDAQRDVKEGVIKRLYDGHQEKQKKSQVFDANSLAAKFQSSGGGNDRKQELSYLESMKKSLDVMAAAGVLNVRIKKN